MWGPVGDDGSCSVLVSSPEGAADLSTSCFGEGCPRCNTATLAGTPGDERGQPPHSQRPTNAGRSAAAKDTIYPNRLSLLSPVGPGAPATGSVKSPTTAVPAASGGTVAVTAVTAVTAP
jgi:hypothetical protein